MRGTIIAVSLLAPLLGFGAEKVTFHKQIEPILQRSCQGCHRPGEAAPFSLLTYQDARPWAKAIKQAVRTGKMPPWFANAAHGKFANDPSLRQAEIDSIVAWVDQGAVAGDAKDAPPAREFPTGWKIGEPDLIVEIPVEFQVPAEGTIDYTWMASDIKLAEDKWIEKIEVRPGNAAVVHHALVFTRAPGSGFRRDLQPGQAQGRPEVKTDHAHPQTETGMFAIGNRYPGEVELIADYVPNGNPFVAAPGEGRLLRAGSHMLFQMHYTSNGKATTDRTRVGIVYAKNPPKTRVVNDAVTNMTLRIPPGAPNHEARGVVTFKNDTAIGGFGPHMHVRGKAMRYELLRDGAEPAEMLLDVPAYDFNWQMKYQPAKWVPVKKGDQLRITAWYDNSPNNRYNPDPTREVFWGEQSWDEMLFAFFDYKIPTESDPALVTGGVPPKKE
jgi:hypothetical protein